MDTMRQTKFKDVAHLYIGCPVQTKISGDPDETAVYGKLLGVPESGTEYRIGFECGTNGFAFGADTKPLLRPLSDITAEERGEYDRIQYTCYSINKFFDQIMTEARITKFLLSKHFDLFGLITTGDAIDSTNHETK